MGTSSQNLTWRFLKSLGDQDVTKYSPDRMHVQGDLSVLSGYLTFLVAKRHDCTYCIEDPMSVCKSTILCRGLWEAVVLNANTLRTQALPSHQLCGQKSHSSCIIHRAFLLGGVPLIPFSVFLGSSLETLPGVCLDAWTPHLHPSTHMAAPVSCDLFHSSYLSSAEFPSGPPAPDSKESSLLHWCPLYLG